MLSHAAVEYAIFGAVVASIATDSVGTVLVSAAWMFVTRRTGLPIVSGFLSVLELGAVYIASVAVLLQVAHYQLDPPRVPGELSFGFTCILLGLLHKLAPLIAVLITWVSLLW